MKISFKQFLLSLLVVPALNVAAQDLQVPALKPARNKAITLGYGYDALIANGSNGRNQLSIGSPTLSLGLQVMAKNNVRHVFSLEAQVSGRIRTFNGTVIGRPNNFLGYEFRKYFDLSATRFHPYIGGFTRLGGVVYGEPSLATGANAHGIFELGASGGLQYDISQRIFLDLGLHLPFVHLEGNRLNSPVFGTTSSSNLELGPGRRYMARLGIGIKF